MPLSYAPLDLVTRLQLFPVTGNSLGWVPWLLYCIQVQDDGQNNGSIRQQNEAMNRVWSLESLETVSLTEMVGFIHVYATGFGGK